MSLLTNLFSPKEVLESVSNGVDAVVNTDEERQELFPAILDKYEPFKLAQRYMMITVNFAVLYIVLLESVLAILSLRYPGTKEVIRLINNLPLVEYLGTAFVVINFFYFGGGSINTFTNIRNLTKKDK